VARGRQQLLRTPLRAWGVVKRHLEQLSLLTHRSDFTLHKGPMTIDSRSSFAALGGPPYLPNARDLSHVMKVEQTRFSVAVGEPVEMRLWVRNTGTVRWLHENLNDFAKVKVGGHLHDGEMVQIDHDFLRAELPRDVEPGEEVKVSFAFRMERAGRYNLVLDMMSERVAWFGLAGSEPVRVEVEVA